MTAKNPFRTDFVRMKFPDTMSPNISIAGHLLEADETGVIEVPKAFVGDCKAHGLFEAPEPAAEAQKPPAKGTK